MLDFEIQRCTRRCAKTDRELQAGEPFYSALVPVGSDVVRFDYSVKAWEGPPDDAIGWWRSQMPDADATKLHWAPNDVILDYFQQLERQPEKADMRFVLALLMVRRRIVRMEQSVNDELGETMTLYCLKNDQHYQVLAAPPTEQRAAEIQQELANLLFADAA